MGTEYKRIIYKYREQILTVILIASSEVNDPKSEQYFNVSLKAVYNVRSTLVDALQTKKVRIQDVFILKMICLYVELRGGTA